jgi:hypothetical protein
MSAIFRSNNFILTYKTISENEVKVKQLRVNPYENMDSMLFKK